MNMPGLGLVVNLIGLSYGIGVLWYALLGNKITGRMRMAAFSVLGVWRRRPHLHRSSGWIKL